MVPIFEHYTDDALGAYTLNHYIQTLSLYGLRVENDFDDDGLMR